MHMSGRGKYTFRLFARPTFLEGMGRLFDFANALQMYRSDATKELADMHALKSDWFAVGDDLRSAMSTYEREQRDTARE